MTILLHHLLISFLLLLLALSANCLPASSSKAENSTPKKQRALSPAPEDTSLYSKHGEEWRKKAIAALWRERKQMAYTPLVVFDKIPGALILFKNESASATESLKHRYSWALVMWALLQGFIHPNSTVYEASSGNTARSEAYMCSLIGAKFVTVLPETTEAIKVANIEREGGRVQKIPFGNTLGRAQQMADEDAGGFFINQFGNSEQALEFHESGNHSLGSVNLFHEILSQMAERNIAGTPTHFIHSAATGGTISSIGRYIKKYGLETEIVLADTQFSAYYDLLVSDRFVNGSEDPQPLWVPPGMAGTGFGWAGPIIRGQTSSLVPEVIDRALKIPDLASVAGMHILRDQFDIDGGPSTGVNFAAALQLIGSVRRRNGKLSNGRAHPPVLATLIADNGVNYRSTYYNQSWIDRSFGPHGGLTGLRCWREVFEQFMNDLRAPENLNGTAAALTESIRDPIQFGAAKCAPPTQSAQ